mgnify:CR=1 FL=1
MGREVGQILNIVSDYLVIIILGDNVVNFAYAAVENVASAIRPCIIIVHNKCNLHEPMDVEVMTEKFLQLHEPDDVLKIIIILTV